MTDKPPLTPFTAIYIDAAKLKENSIPFAVVLEDNQVKCYGVSKEYWQAIDNELLYIKASSEKPLVCLDDGFRSTAEQMGWVIVGDV
jgi:hypothetical protein